MRRSPVVTGQFRKDLDRLRKRGKDLGKLHEVMAVLIAGDALGTRFRDHKLKGPWGGRRECHVEPDWHLIYCLRAAQVIFERTGSHVDLFE